jgi:hypothetical protein
MFRSSLLHSPVVHKALIQCLKKNLPVMKEPEYARPLMLPSKVQRPALNAHTGTHDHFLSRSSPESRTPSRLGVFTKNNQLYLEQSRFPIRGVRAKRSTNWDMTGPSDPVRPQRVIFLEIEAYHCEAIAN